MKRAKKLIALLFVMVAVVAFTSCTDGNQPPASNETATSAAATATAAAATAAPAAEDSGSETLERIPITLGWMYLGDSSAIAGWPDANVPAMAIQDTFNVDFSLLNYDPEKISVDLAAGTLPDIVEIIPDQVEAILKGRHALALDPYLDTLAKNIASYSFRNEMLRQFKSNGEGKLYFRTPHVGAENVLNGDNLSTFGVRWNLYKQIGMPKIETYDDYINVMLQLKEIYPQTEDGLPTYARGVHNSQGVAEWIHTGMGMNGLNKVSTVSAVLFKSDMFTGEIKSDIYTDDENTAFWSSMKYFNKLYNLGLLDPDSFIMKQEDMVAKEEKGQYLSSSGMHYHATGETHDPMEQSVGLPHKEGLYVQDYVAMGWSDKLYFVNANGPNIERAIMVMDYMDADEFGRTVYSGKEGVHWNYNADGVPELLPETIAFAGDPTRATEWEMTEINFWRYHCMVGPGGFEVMDDGYYASLWETPEIYNKRLTPAQKEFSETMGVTYPGELYLKMIAADPNPPVEVSWLDIIACMPATPQEITRIDKACEELVYNSVPTFVTAKTDEDFAAARATLMQQLKGLNAEESINWWFAAWNEARDFMMSLDK